MNYNKFCSFYSVDRVKRYYYASGRNHRRAMILYYQNQKLAKAFHPLLGMYEVVLRNQLDALLTSHFEDPDWILNQRTGFMHNRSIKRRRGRQDIYYLLDLVNKEVEKINNEGGTVTSSRVISELNFGFWTMLFEPSHSSLLGNLPMSMFAGNPDSSWTVQQYYDMVKDIRKFRNRVNHNETIIFSGNTINLTNAKKIYGLIQMSLDWISSSIFTDFEKHSMNSVQTVISEIEGTKRMSCFRRLLSMVKH